MDGGRFDDLARRLARPASRRGVLGLLGAGLVAVVAPQSSRDAEAATVCRSLGVVCAKSGDCCSGSCGPKNRSGRRLCQCDDPGDCPIPMNQCQTAVCQAGVCSTLPVSCVPLDDCHLAGACDSATGVCTNPAKPDGAACENPDACLAGGTCQSGSCVGGTPLAQASEPCAVASDCCGDLTCVANDVLQNPLVCCPEGRIACLSECCQSAGAACDVNGCCESGNSCGTSCCPTDLTCTYLTDYPVALCCASGVGCFDGQSAVCCDSPSAVCSFGGACCESGVRCDLGCCDAGQICTLITGYPIPLCCASGVGCFDGQSAVCCAAGQSCDPSGACV
jgi:hypothetical protein